MEDGCCAPLVTENRARLHSPYGPYPCISTRCAARWRLGTGSEFAYAHHTRIPDPVTVPGGHLVAPAEGRNPPLSRHFWGE